MNEALDSEVEYWGFRLLILLLSCVTCEIKKSTVMVSILVLEFYNRVFSPLESPGSVFDRQKAGRSKPSSQAMPKMYRPSPPQIKPAASMPVAPPAPVVARPGQPQPVALPGMVQFQQPSGPPQRSPSQKLPSTASPAAISPTSTGPPKQPEWKRSPTKPPSTQPVEETRTPFCDACGEEVL